MKMSIKKVLSFKKDLIELYEFKKGSRTSNTFMEDNIKTMKNIRGAIKEIDQQLETIEVEFDLGKMYLSQFEFNIKSGEIGNE